MCGKGTKVVLVPLPPAVGRAIDRAAGARVGGPILLTRISTQEVEGNLSAVNASGIARLTCGNRNRW